MSASSDPSTTTRRTSRTWPQRFTIVGIFICAIACFAAAGGLYAGQQVIEDRNIVVIRDPAESGSGDTKLTVPESDEPSAVGADPEETPENRPVETFPPAEPDARNFLITGADNNSCVDPDSRYAPAFGDRTSLGERSDTIMMWRVNPAASQVVVLSFPRDLWVTIAGRSSKQRINVAYERDDPQRLIETIYENFEVPTDHFVQVDFCAFKTLVDAVDGVAVPFDNPVRDVRTGLSVPEAGCFTFDGDHALAYVRSRKLQFLTADGWVQDGTSDLGRISRQQDFLRRVVSRLLSKGAFNPDVVRGLVETSSEYVVIDDELSAGKVLEFAGVLRDVDPELITTYQIESTPQNIQGNAVLVPTISGANMQAILRVFRGEATLASAPEQVFASTTTSSTVAPSGFAPVLSGFRGTPTTPLLPSPTTTLPIVEPEENTLGFVPDSSIVCS
jgi:LCP family protein required for cell wall assembly